MGARAYACTVHPHVGPPGQVHLPRKQIRSALQWNHRVPCVGPAGANPAQRNHHPRD
jgi:hypothetical protein